MAYEAHILATGITGGARQLALVRTTVDGYVFVAHYDGQASPKRCVVWFSIGEGRPGTWAAETWSQAVGGPEVTAAPYSTSGDGGADPVLMVDPADRIWLACSSYGGVASPHILMRNADEQVWARARLDFSGFARLSNHTSVSSFHAVMDSGHTDQGIWNIGTVWILSNRAYYSDTACGGSQQEIDPANTNYVACRIVATAGGTKTVFLLDSSGDLWTAQKTTKGLGGWSARVQVNSGGQSVTSIEDACVAPWTQPACIYRVLVGSVNRLHFAEFDNFATQWNNQRVWDDANDRAFYPGQSMSYDNRGSVFVVGPYDHDGDLDANDAHIFHWDHLRGLDPTTTTWSGTDRTSGGVGGTILDTETFRSRTPALGGFTPGALDQGLAFVCYLWGPGQTVNQQGIVFVNRDTLVSAATVYPTIFPLLAGEPLPRAPDTSVRSTAVIDDPGSAGAFPSGILPVYDYTEADEFATNQVTVVGGYHLTMARFTSGQVRYIVRFGPPGLTPAQFATLDAFVVARMRDGQTFTFVPPKRFAGEVVTARTVRILPSPPPDREQIANRNGDRLWVYSFQMIEEGV